MNQFIPYFLGEKTPENKRIVNIQRCIRAGGKHNDLEDVGMDSYHHTFFKMLGSWSFGDYFKEEAISLAWEFLTKKLKFPKERLYVTVFKSSSNKYFQDPYEDYESYNYWEKIFKQENLNPKKHIIFQNEQDNFWTMGNYGPCGPSTEIHVDLTLEGNTNGNLVNKNSPYCLELWNLVFIEFNLSQNRNIKKLNNKHVDTGMGLERLSSIIKTTNHFKTFNKIPSSYDCDIFIPIFDYIEKISGLKYNGIYPLNKNKLSTQELIDSSFRIIVDHVRTIAFALKDKIFPSNEKRGYIIRKIIRRALLFGRNLNMKKYFLSNVLMNFIKENNEFNNLKKEDLHYIKQIIIYEENSFITILHNGITIINKLIEKNKTLSEENIWYLYDTHGVPPYITSLIAKDKGYNINLHDFNIYKKKHNNNTKNKNFEKKILSNNIDLNLEQYKETIFDGYNINNLENFETYLNGILNIHDQLFVMFEKTIFFPNKGGQEGDTGFFYIKKNQKKILINNTKNIIIKNKNYILHEISDLDYNSCKECLNMKIKIYLNIDKNKRELISINHTATHLLNFSLKKILNNDNISQQGSYVCDQYLRFDFNYHESLSYQQIYQIEQFINSLVQKNSNVVCYNTTFNKKPLNCVYLENMNYNDNIRVVDIGKYSIELCSGTHVNQTGKIGLCKIISCTSIKQNIKRIKMTTGKISINLMQKENEQLHNVSKRLNCSLDQIIKTCELISNKSLFLKKTINEYKKWLFKYFNKILQKKSIQQNNINYIIQKTNFYDESFIPDLLKYMSSQFIGLIILYNIKNNKAKLFINSTHKNFNANNILKFILKELKEGNGGGNINYASSSIIHNVHTLESILSTYVK